MDHRQNIYKTDAFSFTSSVLKLLTVVLAYFYLFAFQSRKTFIFKKLKRQIKIKLISKVLINNQGDMAIVKLYPHVEQI